MRLTSFPVNVRNDRPGTGGRLILLLIIVVIFTLSSRAEDVPAGKSKVQPVVHAVGV
jgi:hypothetical protein